MPVSEMIRLAEFTALEALTLQEARLSLTALSRLKQLPNLKRLTLDSIRKRHRHPAENAAQDRHQMDPAH